MKPGDKKTRNSSTICLWRNRISGVIPVEQLLFSKLKC